MIPFPADDIPVYEICSAMAFQERLLERDTQILDDRWEKLIVRVDKHNVRQRNYDKGHYVFCMTRTFSSAPQSRAIQAYVHSYEAHYERMRHDLTFSGRRLGGTIPSPMAGKESKLSRAHIPDLKLAK